MSMNNHGRTEKPKFTDNGTEVLHLLEEDSYRIQQQSTEVIHFSEENISQHVEKQAAEVFGVLNENSSQGFSSTADRSVNAPSPAKATSMGRVMEYVSRLPGIDEGDDLWMAAYDFLANSEAARELLVSRRVNPSIKTKWLEAQVKKFKN